MIDQSLLNLIAGLAESTSLMPWEDPGHTSTAFQDAEFIHRRYGLVYSIPAYIGAVFVGYSRVESGYHFTKDILAGAAVGIGSVFLFTRPYHRVTLTPVAEGGYFGIDLSTIW